MSRVSQSSPHHGQRTSRRFKKRRKRQKAHAVKRERLDRRAARKAPVHDTEPDWDTECEVCGSKPVVPATGMCGPCTFGEAETAGGNW